MDVKGISTSVNEDVIQEIEWAQKFVTFLKRQQEDKPLKLPKFKTKCHLSYQMVKRPASLQNTKIIQPFRNKCLFGSKIINRYSLTRKQHIQLLANPRKLVYDTHEFKTVKRSHCPYSSPRIIKLSLPRTNRVMINYQTYGHTLSSWKKENLLRLMAENKNGLAPEQVHEYFEHLKRKRYIKRRKAKKKKLKKRKTLTNNERRYIKKFAQAFAIIISSYLCENQVVHLTGHSKQISDAILKNLKQFKYIKKVPSLASKKISDKALRHASDNAASFVANALKQLEEIQEENEKKRLEETWESTTTIETEEVAETIEEEEEEREEKEEEEEEESLPCSVELALEEAAEEEPFLRPKKGFDFFMKDLALDEEEGIVFDPHELLRILKKYGRIIKPDPTHRVFSEANLPDLTLQNMIEQIDKILKLSIKESPYSRIQKAFYDKLSNYVETISPESLTKDMKELICDVSKKLAREIAGFTPSQILSEEIIQSEASEIEEMAPEQVAEEHEIAAIEKEIMDEAIKELFEEQETDFLTEEKMIAEEGEILIDEEEIEENLEEEEGEKEEEVEEDIIAVAEEKEIETTDLDTTPKIELFPHTADMVCCASLKSWALFVSEVSNNSKQWCLWIHKILQDLLHISAIIRGEIYDDNGQLVQFSLEKWKRFTKKLDDGVERWHKYNVHVQESSDAIIKNFHGKRVVCCHLCAKENIDFTTLSSEHLCEKLSEQFKTMQLWRTSLSKMIEEAGAIAKQIRDVDKFSITEVPDEAFVSPTGIGRPPSEYSLIELPGGVFNQF